MWFLANIYTDTENTFQNYSSDTFTDAARDAQTLAMECNETGMVNGSEMLGLSKLSHEFISTRHALRAS